MVRFGIRVVCAAIATISTGPICNAEPLRTPVIVDRDGKLMGPVTNVYYEAVAVALRLQTGRPPVSVVVVQGHFLQRRPKSILVWESRDCTGQPYLNDISLVPTAFLEGDTFYFPDSKSLPRTIVVKSFHVGTGACYGLGGKGGEVAGARQALTTSAKALGFTPPFSPEFR